MLGFFFSTYGFLETVIPLYEVSTDAVLSVSRVGADTRRWTVQVEQALISDGYVREMKTEKGERNIK